MIQLYLGAVGFEPALICVVCLHEKFSTYFLIGFSRDEFIKRRLRQLYFELFQVSKMSSSSNNQNPRKKDIGNSELLWKLMLKPIQLQNIKRMLQKNFGKVVKEDPEKQNQMMLEFRTKEASKKANC